jgi:hypothetical protein
MVKPKLNFINENLEVWGSANHNRRKTKSLWGEWGNLRGHIFPYDQ